MVVEMLMYEPLELDSQVCVLEDAIEFGDMDFSLDIAREICDTLQLNPVNKPLLFKLHTYDFCNAVAQIGRKVVVASKI